MATRESAQLPITVLGRARLPNGIVGDSGCTVLLFEITYDPHDRRILDVATNLSLTGYTSLLKRVLIGGIVDDAVQQATVLERHYRGPLSKATVAAIANAVANCGALPPTARLPEGVRERGRP